MRSYNEDPNAQLYDYWWREEKDSVAEAVFCAVESLDQDQDYVRQANLHHLRLYSNRIASGLSGHEYAISDDGDRIKVNVIKAVIDAAAAQIASNRPKPMYVTSGGKRSQKKRAEGLNKFVSGLFYYLDLYRLGLRVFFDGAIFGTGYMKISDNDGEIFAERIFPDEILVDDVEAKCSEPRTLYQHKEVPRETAINTWPKFSELLEDSKLIRNDTYMRASSPADPISVIEAWHLPEGKDGKHGKHVICTSEALLLDEDWTDNTFPFSVWRWANAPLGHRGIGIAEELTSIQIEINFLCQKLQELTNLQTTQIWAKRGDGIGQLDNENMALRYFKTTPPVALSIPIPPELSSRLDWLFARAFEITGVNQMMAQGQIPVGVKSGEAIRRVNEVSSKRFEHVGQEWERFFVGMGDLILDAARRIDANGDAEDLKVLSGGNKEIKEIKFKDVSLDKDKYVTRVFPTSIMPDTPQGKIETITELAQSVPEMGRHVLSMLTGIPDLESVVNRVEAPYQLIDQYLERIIDHGEYNPPLPYMDLNLARQQAVLELNRGHKEGVAEERLEMLRQFVDQCNDLAARAAQPEQPPSAPGPPAGAPGEGAPLPGAQPPPEAVLPPDALPLPVA